MFYRLLRRRAQRLSRGIRRSARKNSSRSLGRTLHHETLEDRRVLTLLGVAPLTIPTFNYDFGATSYDSSSNVFSVVATPLDSDTEEINSLPPSEGIFLIGSLEINIEVDESGGLVGGVPGDDFELLGVLDRWSGNPDPEHPLEFYDSDDGNGPLLTGEIVAFGHQDSGGTTDEFDFEFVITGGQLAFLFPDNRLGMTLTSDGPTFTGDFNVDFGGTALGQFGWIEEEVVENPAIDLEKLVNGVDADTPETAPEVDAGDLVLFTYQVTNTGDVPFDFADVVIVDDNGTPGDSSDDVSTTGGGINFVFASDLGGDLILSPGETWQYEYATTAIALPGDDVYANSATATAPGASDSDLGHYANPDVPLPNEAPTITFGFGQVNYDSSANTWSLDAEPLNVVPGFFLSGDFDISVIVDETGALVSGVGGSDLVLAGDLDLNGDLISDLSGVILTGEIISFASTNSGGTTDFYTLRFEVTGGLLASVYSGQDIVVTVRSENSTFTGDFTNDFGGDASGDITAVESTAALMASVGNYFFLDTNGNGLQNTGDFGINGVTVNLLDGVGNVIASTETANDSNGNAGFYLFYNLQAGNYAIEFEVPEGVLFTTKDGGDDARDSDVNESTGITDVFALETGEHRRDVDAGILALVSVEETIYKIVDHKTQLQLALAGKVDSVDLQYNESQDELSVSIDFVEFLGSLTEGFTFVITPGQWPGGAQDKYAVFYFDADVHNRNGGPVLTVYGYNGRYNASSYLSSDWWLHNGDDADRIATSLNNSDNWVHQLDVETYKQGGKWHRTMTFRIDASVVNQHIPLQQVNWSGAQFQNSATYAISTYDGLYAKYNPNGFLKKWDWSRRGVLIGYRMRAEETVVVTEVAIEELLDDFGWVMSAYDDGSSDGDPPVNPNDDASDLDWAGSVDAALEDAFA